MTWSPLQEMALSRAKQWLSSDEQIFTLFGYAGTGKSTLAKHLVENEGFLFAAYSGKAANVLRLKGCSPCGTIHGTIYKPAGEKVSKEVTELSKELLILRIREPNNAEAIAALETKLRIVEMNTKRRPRFQLWDDSPLTRANGIVIDECSMVDAQVGMDLLSFGKKVLVLGDPEQLPPVGSGGFFTNRTPDVMLTEVHRHALDSGILSLATFIREKGNVRNFDPRPYRDLGIQVAAGTTNLQELILGADQCLVGRNATRRRYNARQREILGRTSPFPETGDRVICLRNDRDQELLNGSLFEVTRSRTDDEQMITDMDLTSTEDGRRTVVLTWAHHFVGRGDELKGRTDKRDFQEFDWSYFLSVHKAQGSQFEKVVVFDESGSFGSAARRWLYTAVTRASKELTVIL